MMEDKKMGKKPKNIKKCECGKKAKHFPWVHKGQLPLCDGCYEEYMEEKKRYGGNK